MLAPTRELVADLNRRARDHRLDGAPTGQEVRLGDGNRASVGDMIITRPMIDGSDSVPPTGLRTAIGGSSPVSAGAAI
jgi:hypothetical protein